MRLYATERKVPDQKGLYISLSDGNFSILSALVVVACSVPSTYTRLYRGLEYLLKVRYIILDDPNVAGL